MLLVKTSLRPSPISGIGLFAEEMIRANTPIWNLNPKMDIVFTEEEFFAMSALEKEFVKKYTYKTNGSYVLCVDNGRFMNHSEDPNTFESEVETIARIDIHPGEEITCNYHHFCEDGLNFI